MKRTLLLAATVFLMSQNAKAEVSDCFDHYNPEAWDGDGLAIVLCRNSPDLDRCEIRRHGGERLQGLSQHGDDAGRPVFTDYNTTGDEYPFAIDIVCENSQVTLTFELGNGANRDTGCCRNREYGPESCCGTEGEPACEDPDYKNPQVGSPGGAACPLLRSRTFSGGARLLDVLQCSETQLDFLIDDVPDPSNLSYAELTMVLTDSDHPGEEGTVWVNNHGPLQLPAREAWDDETEPASIPIPVSYLKAGTNSIEFGAGPRDRTYFKVDRLALQVEGEACESDPEPEQDGGRDAGSDAGSDAGPDDDPETDAGVDAGTDAGADPGSESCQENEDCPDGLVCEDGTCWAPDAESNGCGCGTGSRTPDWLLLVLFLLIAVQRHGR